MPSAKLMRMARLAASDAVEPKLRHKIAVELAQAYFDADDVQALDEYLQEFDGEHLTVEQRETVLRFLILRGNYEKAYQWIERYTPYFAEAKILLRLTDALISQSVHDGEPALYAAALSVFAEENTTEMFWSICLIMYRERRKSCVISGKQPDLLK